MENKKDCRHRYGYVDGNYSELEQRDNIVEDTVFPYTVTTKVNITRDQLTDLLCCGLEGGINYWATYRAGYNPSPEGIEHHSKGVYGGMPIYAVGHPEYSLIIRDIEETKEHTLTLKKLRLGIAVMASKFPDHFMYFLQDNCDAETGDVFVQCCVFGDIIYG
jgi:hypothetical protein